MINKNIRIICRVLIFFIIFGIIFWRVDYIMRNKMECQFISHFKEEKQDSIDVVFLGSSQVVVGMQPLQLWENTGITSYNCATSATNIPMMYYTAKMAIENQHPKVIVADVSFICDDTPLTATERFHAIWDNFYTEVAKYEAISDIVPKENRFEMYFPIYLYHSRWDSLTQTDFKEIGSNDEFKGAKVYTEIVLPTTITALKEYPSENVPINDVAYEYLDKLIELCKNNGTELVLVAMPLPYLAADFTYLQTLNSVESLANERGIIFENGYKDQSLWGLDYYTDFIDVSHVNFRGAKKVTDYIEKLLCSNFSIEDKRNNPTYTSWNEEYDRYEEFINTQCAYQRYGNGAIIDFVSQYQNTFFVNGLWPSNGQYSWSGGKQNDAFFYLDAVENASEVYITFDFGDVFTDEVECQDVEIYVNDNLCSQWSIDKRNVSEPFTCTVPIKYINVEDVNHLLVVYKNIQGDVRSQYQDVKLAENPYYALAYEYVYISYDQ